MPIEEPPAAAPDLLALLSHLREHGPDSLSPVEMRAANSALRLFYKRDGQVRRKCGDLERNRHLSVKTPEVVIAEVVSDILMCKSVPTFEYTYAWLARVAMNRILDALRAADVQGAVDRIPAKDGNEEERPSSLEAWLPAPGGPDEQLVSDDDGDRFSRAAQRFLRDCARPANKWTDVPIFIQAYLAPRMLKSEGVQGTEVASSLGITESKVTRSLQSMGIRPPKTPKNASLDDVLQAWAQTPIGYYLVELCGIKRYEGQRDRIWEALEVLCHYTCNPGEAPTLRV